MMDSSPFLIHVPVRLPEERIAHIAAHFGITADEVTARHAIDYIENLIVKDEQDAHTIDGSNHPR